MMSNIDKDIELLKKIPLVPSEYIDEDGEDVLDMFITFPITQNQLVKAIRNVISELEKYKNVTYFEKLEDGELHKIDKERADDLYKHGNGNWLYIQMWKRNED